MTLATGLMAYAILWWLVFFMVLPWGVRTVEETGDMEPGHAPSAPARPRLLLKVAVTTLVSAAVFLVAYSLVASGIIDLRGYFTEGL